MGNVVCSIQHGSVDESLGIFYEDLLRCNNCKNMSLIHFQQIQEKFQKLQQIEIFLMITFNISGLFVHRAGLGPLYQPITWKERQFKLGRVSKTSVTESVR